MKPMRSEARFGMLATPRYPFIHSFLFRGADAPHRSRFRLAFAVTAAVLAFGTFALAQAPSPAGRYALILSDSPVAAQLRAADRPAGAGAQGLARNRVVSAQALVRNELSSRNLRPLGSATDVLNAVFVAASPERVAELRNIPGVVGIVRLGRRKLLLNTATALLNAPQAWTLVGGLSNAGAGIKIGVLDTGIDQTHPMLQDSSLAMPAGFPKCDTPSDCVNFTSTKVIVARSYVSILAAGIGPNPAANSQPDDYSARDRVGHGTAVATVAAGNTATGAVTINGIAPKAYLGNYKIAGSPGVNDGATDDAIIAAVDDAVKDGMDIITLSFGSAATTGPLDTGAACGLPAGTPCDPLATAFENAAAAGRVILSAAGNEGDGGAYGTATSYPTYNTIDSPADAPSVIAVGGASNTHSFSPAVVVTGSNVPGNLTLISGATTSAYSPYGAYSGPLVDIGSGCAAQGPLSLNGFIALVQAGSCSSSTKMTNAVNAGAIGVIFRDNINEPLSQFYPNGLSNFSQAAIAISNTDGQNLKAFIASNPGRVVTIDPAASEVSLPDAPVLVDYSSFGPALGTSGLKPDILGIAAGSQNGDLIYVGAQNFDPLGEVYSSNRYIAVSGTSFATPLVAGIAALVKQQHPGYSAQQIRSAIVNTASQAITADDFGKSVNVLQTGSGLAVADAAVTTNVTIVPSTISFGSFAPGSASGTQTLAFSNTGTGPVTLTLTVQPTAVAAGTAIAVNPTTVSIAPGVIQNVTVGLTGSIASAGLYYGNILVTGGSVPLHVPYMFISPAGSLGTIDLNPVLGDGDVAVTGQQIPDGNVAFQLTDANGAPVSGVPVSFTQGRGSVPLTLSDASTSTDQFGYAYANVTAGQQTGNYVVRAAAGGQSYQFTGSVIAQPTINVQNGVIGVVNAAPANASSPIAPGSYAAIYGSNLAPSAAEFYTSNALPLSLNNITVSFDAPPTGSLPALSVPGYIRYADGNQVNVFVPWELQGYSSAQVKVTVNENDYGTLVTVPLSNYAPAFFETSAGNAAALDANNQVITPSHAAARGQTISLYMNGLGPVDNQPASGFPASTTILSHTTQTPEVSIGGQPAQVSFSGLAPSFVGLYQVNVIVPTNIGTGAQAVSLSIGGQTTKASGITVQ